jgi:phage host-nuclease inhibitor protein Gam
MEGGTKLFVLVGKLKTAEAAATFLKWRERIVSTTHEKRGAVIAKIRRDGVHVWLREQEWRRRR